MTVQENAAPPKRRRRTELPQLPLMQQKLIFGTDIPKLAAQEGRKSPGKGTIQKLTSRAGRQAARGPKVAGYIGKRPVYEPQDALDWLDSLVTPEPRTIGVADAMKAKPTMPVPEPPVRPQRVELTIEVSTAAPRGRGHSRKAALLSAPPAPIADPSADQRIEAISNP
jgi:hypothetical protein